MGNQCSCSEDRNVTEESFEDATLGLENMEILEYERRVKRFSFAASKFITFYQLREAFKGTNVFPNLDNSDSPTY